MAKFCSKCRAALEGDMKFCSSCGAPQTNEQGAPRTLNRNRKDKTTAGILGILLGGLGVHKFYLGDTVKGIIYLLTCWTVIPGIIGLVEGIKYLTMSNEEFDERYNNA